MKDMENVFRRYSKEIDVRKLFKLKKEEVIDDVIMHEQGNKVTITVSTNQEMI